MNIEGTYTLQAPGEEVWHYLMDQEILHATIPGVESVEQIDKNTYDIIITVQYASLKGSYRGHLTHSEQQYPYHYRLNIEGEGSQGTFNGSGSVHLNTHENTTIIAYKGTLTTSKLWRTSATITRQRCSQTFYPTVLSSSSRATTK